MAPPSAFIRRAALAMGLALLAGATGCLTASIPGEDSELPAMRPEVYFGGLTTGEGVLRLRGRRPQPFTVVSRGWTDADGAFRLAQTITYAGGRTERRQWHLWPRRGGRYVGTLTGARGEVTAEAQGNLLVLSYPIRPDLRVEQRLWLQPDGRTVVNRGTLRMLFVRVGHLDETITRRTPIPVDAAPFGDPPDDGDAPADSTDGR